MLLLAAALFAAPTPAVAVIDAAKPATSSTNCPRTTSYYAYRDGKPLAPHKLTELPPANTYMAVYRRIGGCEVPLTMSDYRNPRRR